MPERPGGYGTFVLRHAATEAEDDGSVAVMPAGQPAQSVRTGSFLASRRKEKIIGDASYIFSARLGRVTCKHSDIFRIHHNSVNLRYNFLHM